jgi:hypothetical protein
MAASLAWVFGGLTMQNFVGWVKTELVQNGSHKDS